MKFKGIKNPNELLKHPVLTGLAKVHTHVVSATTHLTTATTLYRKLRKRDLYLPLQECIVKVAIALAGDIRSLETFWEGEGGGRESHVFGCIEDFIGHRLLT